MADRELLDAILRLEATNREDHVSLQSQIRGFAGRTIKIEGDVDALAGSMRERNEACIRRHAGVNRTLWAIGGGFGGVGLSVVLRFLGVI